MAAGGPRFGWAGTLLRSFLQDTDPAFRGQHFQPVDLLAAPLHRLGLQHPAAITLDLADPGPGIVTLRTRRFGLHGRHGRQGSDQQKGAQDVQHRRDTSLVVAGRLGR